MIMHSVVSVRDVLTFDSLDLESSFFGTYVQLQNLQVKFVCQRHRVKVKVKVKVKAKQHSCVSCLWVDYLRLKGNCYLV